MVIALWAIVVGGALLCLGALVALGIVQWSRGDGANVVLVVCLFAMAGGAVSELVGAVVVLMSM